MILEGAVDTLAFEASVEQVLVPSLSPGQVVVLDNLGVYKGEHVRQMIDAKGCQVMVLPAYSPDFAPIEQANSRAKSLAPSPGGRTREAMEEAIALALEQITAQDAHGWFWHCGYLPQKPEKGSAYEVPA